MPGSPSARERVVTLGLLLGLPVMFLLVADLVVPQTNDDAFIFCRFAENAVAGLGPVFNPGERVEGFTSPLWLLLLVVARAFSSGELVPIAQGLSTAATLVAYLGLLALLRLARVQPRFMVLAAFAFLASPVALVWARSGMETMLAAALLVWALVAVERARQLGTRASSVLAALVLVLLVAVRPEGIAWALVVVGGVALAGRAERRLEHSVTLCALALLSFLAITVARYAYFHALLPNTAVAKLGGGGSFWVRGLTYVAGYVWQACLPALLLGLAAARRPPAVLLRATLAVVAAALGIVVLESGDFMWFWRFCAPTWPLVVALGALGVDALSQRCAVGRFAATLGGTLTAFVPMVAAFDGDLAMRAHGIDLDARNQTAFARQLGGLFNPGDSVALGPLGRFVYYARPTAAWDTWGLVVPEIARGPRTPGKVGHERRSSEALLARRPTFVVWKLGWAQQLPCAHVDAHGRAQALEPDFAAFNGRADYLPVYVRHPTKPWLAPLLVRADRRQASRRLALFDMAAACREASPERSP